MTANITELVRRFNGESVKSPSGNYSWTSQELSHYFGTPLGAINQILVAEDVKKNKRVDMQEIRSVLYGMHRQRGKGNE
jgi:hypothetical protein